jgi:hypothetical protein
MEPKEWAPEELDMMGKGTLAHSVFEHLFAPGKKVPTGREIREQLPSLLHNAISDLMPFMLSPEWRVSQPNSQFNRLRNQYLECLRYLKLAQNYLPGGYDLLFSSDPEKKEERQAQEADFGDAWKSMNGTKEWFESRKYGVSGGSRKELYIEAREYSEICKNAGLKHLHLSPIEALKSILKAASFQPPYLKCFVNFTGRHPKVMEKMSELTPSTLNAVSLPVFGNTGSNNEDQFQFLMPLFPIIETQKLAETLCKIITELYETVILPAFNSES